MNEKDTILRPLLPKRLAAMVYDTFLVLPIVMASVALLMGIRVLIVDGTHSDINEVELNAHLVQFVVVAVVTGFFSWFWARTGQTLGMQAWRIKLVSLDSQPVSKRQAIIRCLGAILSALCLGAGYWWCLFDPNRRYWHDYLSGTELILLPKPESKKDREEKTAAVQKN